MTLFAEPARPAWMLAHHPLSTPDALIPLRDPAELKVVEERAEAWSAVAETERDQSERLFTLEDRPLADGPLLYRADKQTTPAAAWAWYCAVQHAPGHRVVLVDPSKPNLLEESK